VEAVEPDAEARPEDDSPPASVEAVEPDAEARPDDVSPPASVEAVEPDAEARPDDLGDGELDEREPQPVADATQDIDADGDDIPVDGAPVDDVAIGPASVGLVDRAAITDDTGDVVPASTVDIANASDASVVDSSGAGLWSPADAESLRERWRQIQLHFVDDPRSAADDAAGLVDEAASALIATIESRRVELAQVHSSAPAAGEAPGQVPETPRDGGETERLRVSVQRYREFLDRVLEL
jgi:hypothetical protein